MTGLLSDVAVIAFLIGLGYAIEQLGLRLRRARGNTELYRR